MISIETRTQLGGAWPVEYSGSSPQAQGALAAEKYGSPLQERRAITLRLLSALHGRLEKENVFVVKNLPRLTTTPNESKRRTPREILSIAQPRDIEVSPDGSQALVKVVIANWQRGGYESQVYLLRMGSPVAPEGHTCRMDLGGHIPLKLQWHPSGQSFAYIGGKQNDIWWHSSDSGTLPIRITQLQHGGASDFQWDPAGKSIAFVTRDSIPQSQAFENETPLNRLWLMDVVMIPENGSENTSNLRLLMGEKDWEIGHGPRLSLSSSPKWLIDWSPDGKAIVFSHVPHNGSKGLAGLATVSLETGSVLCLTRPDETVLMPRYSPDGRHIAAMVLDMNQINPEIKSVSVAGKRV